MAALPLPWPDPEMGRHPSRKRSFPGRPAKINSARRSPRTASLGTRPTTGVSKPGLRDVSATIGDITEAPARPRRRLAATPAQPDPRRLRPGRHPRARPRLSTRRPQRRALPRDHHRDREHPRRPPQTWWARITLLSRLTVQSSPSSRSASNRNRSAMRCQVPSNAQRRLRR